MHSTRYEEDIVGWANEQAQLLREGRYDQLDLQHLAEEIEDVGKSEQRELANRMAVLMAHLLKWKYQPERQGNSWRATIRAQRIAIARRLLRTPGLKHMLDDPGWREEIWADAVAQATEETGLSLFPVNCPWVLTQVLEEEWLPE